MSRENEEHRITEDLRSLLAEVNRELERISQELATTRATRDRYERALIQLTGEKRAARSSKHAPGKNGSTWTVSDAKVDQVWNRIQELAPQGTFRPGDVATDGLSSESVRRALGVLRDRELIRLAGRGGRGNGSLYALMPAREEVSNGVS